VEIPLPISALIIALSSSYGVYESYSVLNACTAGQEKTCYLIYDY